MKTPLISILIDTYNYGHYVEEAIDSALTQDFPEEQREILVVDDGSTDDTAERVKKYGDRVRYVKKANGGQASAFNIGFVEARGEVIAFLDGDDYWLPGKLRRLAEEFEKNPSVGFVHHRLREFDTQTGEQRNGPFAPMNGNVATNAKTILAFNPTPTSSLAFRRQALEKILPMPEAITIQADGYIQALVPFVAPIAAIDEVLAVYRIHGTNLYFLSPTQKTVEDLERRKRRALTLQAILDGLKEWFRTRGYKSNDPVIRATISRWTTLLEREEFEIEIPSRVRFFWHLVQTYRNHSPLMTWRLVLINYTDAVGALAVGYKRFPQWERTRQACIDWMRRLAGKNSGVSSS